MREPVTMHLNVVATPSDDRASGVVANFVWQSHEIRAEGEISRQRAGLAVSSLLISSLNSAPAGLTRDLLRKVPFGTILGEARVQVAGRDGVHYPVDASAGTDLPPGRVQITDDLLRLVAVVYLEETGPGKDRSALQRMAERLGRPKGTIRTWIGRARESGWLGPGVQGRMGAEPGPRLIAEEAAA